MSDQTAAESGKWRPPSNARELIATVVALALTLATVQVLAPLAKQATFLTEEIRNYVAGLGFALFPPSYRVLNLGLQNAGGRAGLVRPDLSPWFVTGITAAALLFVWNTFVATLSGLGIGAVLAQVSQSQSFDTGAVTSALSAGSLLITVPLTAIASVFAGMLLNRWTRSGVVAALVLSSLTYLTLNIFLTSILTPDALRAMLEQSRDVEQAAGVGVGVALVAIITFLFGGLGVLISRMRRERSIGRLVMAARKLSSNDRDAVTDDVLAMIERKRR